MTLQCKDAEDFKAQLTMCLMHSTQSKNLQYQSVQIHLSHDLLTSVDLYVVDPDRCSLGPMDDFKVLEALYNSIRTTSLQLWSYDPSTYKPIIQPIDIRRYKNLTRIQCDLDSDYLIYCAGTRYWYYCWGNNIYASHQPILRLTFSTDLYSRIDLTLQQRARLIVLHETLKALTYIKSKL